MKNGNGNDTSKLKLRCDWLLVQCAVREANGGNAAMYAGLAVALLVFVIVIIFIVCLIRRRIPLVIGQLLTYLPYLTLPSGRVAPCGFRGPSLVSL